LQVSFKTVVRNLVGDALSGLSPQDADRIVAAIAERVAPVIVDLCAAHVEDIKSKDKSHDGRIFDHAIARAHGMLIDLKDTVASDGCAVERHIPQS